MEELIERFKQAAGVLYIGWPATVSVNGELLMVTCYKDTSQYTVNGFKKKVERLEQTIKQLQNE